MLAAPTLKTNPVSPALAEPGHLGQLRLHLWTREAACGWQAETPGHGSFYLFFFFFPGVCLDTMAKLWRQVRNRHRWRIFFFFWLVLRNPVNIFTNGTLGRKILEHRLKQLLVIEDTCQVSYWSSPVWWQACLPDCYIVNSHRFLNCFLLLTWMDCLERHILFCAWVPSPLQWFSRLFTWFSIFQCLLTPSTTYNGRFCVSSVICRQQCAIYTISF